MTETRFSHREFRNEVRLATSLGIERMTSDASRQIWQRGFTSGWLHQFWIPDPQLAWEMSHVRPAKNLQGRKWFYEGFTVAPRLEGSDEPLGDLR